MTHAFNLKLIAKSIIGGFAGPDLAAKMESATKLSSPLTPYTTGDDSDNVHLNAIVVAQLLPGLLRAAYKRLAYTFVTRSNDLTTPVESMSAIEIKMREAAVKAGKAGDAKTRAQIDTIADSVDDIDTLFDDMSPDQENLAEDSYRPDRAAAEYDVAVLESVAYHLARKYKDRKFSYLLDGITQDVLIDGKIVSVTTYPSPKDVQQWRTSTGEFIEAAMERTGDQKVGSLLKGLNEMGGSYTTPLYSGDTQALALDFSHHWKQVGANMTEVLGEKFAHSFFAGVEAGDLKRTEGALKKWEVMLSSIGALALFTELVTSDAWDDETTNRYERDLERANARGAMARQRAQRSRRIALLEKGMTGEQADMMMTKEDAALAAAEAIATAQATPAVIPAPSDEAYEAPAARTVGPKTVVTQPIEVAKQKPTTGKVRKGAKKGAQA